MPRHRIQPGWRYTIAQKLLALLFGRPWHYISPWKGAGVATGIIMVNGKRVLLAQRAGAVERAGTWSVPGGFVSLAAHESLAVAACRELEEETGFKAAAKRFPAYPTVSLVSYNRNMHEEADTVVLCNYYFFSVPADIINHLKPSDETSAFCWASQEEVAAMRDDGRIHPDFTDMRESLDEAFRRLNTGQTFPPLPT